MQARLAAPIRQTCRSTIVVARLGFDEPANLRRDVAMVFGVEQHAAAVASQPPGPSSDHRRSSESHQRVEHAPAVHHAAREGGDGEHGRERVGEHVQVGGLRL